MKKKMGRKKGSTNKNTGKVVKRDSEGKNIQREQNEVLVKDEYARLLKEKGTRPTVKEVADSLGLHSNTVKSILKDVKYQPSNDPLRVLTPKVVESIYNTAIAGSTQAQKLWLQVMEGYSENQGIDQQSNYNTDTSSSDEEDLQDKLKEHLFRLNVLEIVIARIANKKGLPSHFLVKQLRDSYYAKYSKVLKNAREDDTEIEFPSEEVYDFDEIKVSAYEKEKEVQQAKEEPSVEHNENVSETNEVKNKILERLKNKSSK